MPESLPIFLCSPIPAAFMLQISASSSAVNGATKPLPSYEELKKQSEKDLVKVGSFLQGKTMVVIQEKKPSVGSSDDPADAEDLIKVPLVDKHAQGALRRRVVHDQLERT